MIRLVSFALVAALVCLAFPSDACAYLDLGSGSYLFQLIIATFLGGIFTVKAFWHKIKGFFKK